MNFRSFAQVLQEMLDYLAGTASALTDFNVGSATRSLLEGVALVLGELHYLAEQLILRFFVQTAPGQWLDLRAEEFGLARILASPTSRVVTVGHGGGTPAVTIPVGHQFRTLPGAAVQVTYQVTVETILAAGSHTANVPVVATVAGSAGNLPNATALQQVGVALAAIDTIVTGAISTAGVDRETDDALRARVLFKIQHPAGPGSQADYVGWALAAPGGNVGSAATIPLWAGPGTVKVLILGAGNTVPSGGEIAAVQDYIDPAPSGTGAGMAPIGATVTVAAPTLKTVDAKLSITPAAGFDPPTVQANAATAMAAYLDGLGIGEDVRLVALVAAAWAVDGLGGPLGTDGGNIVPSSIQIRISPAAYAAADIVIAADEKSVAGTVTITLV